jgi:lipopolysaccharide biosynthesis glycosyltransferase
MILIVPTDGNYLEPAFITLNSLAINAPHGTKICLLYLRDLAEDDLIFEALIAEAQVNFLKIYKDKILFSSIAVRSNYFKDFSKFHLTSATLQKLVIPAIFPSEDICISIDAGMIFGCRLEKFIEQVQKPSTAAITAFTTAASSSLQKEQLSIDHHDLYPAGGVLAFRPEIYNKSELLERCVNTYSKLRSDIIYGEQDIICFTLRDFELCDFSYDGPRIHIDLASDLSWTESNNLVQTYISNDFLYMKHVGIFKPWRRWVLSPAKSIYTHALVRLPAAINLLTKHPKLVCQHASSDKFSPLFFESQLSMYEEQLCVAIDIQFDNSIIR